MIRVVLPAHLRTLARVGSEVEVAVEGQPTLGGVLDAIEVAYPVLRGTIRDHDTERRRPFVRFFACEQDLSHEAIQDCAVIGLPDDKWGERVVAVVQPRAGRSVDVAAVSAFVKQRVGSVKTPKQIEVWDDLPRSKVGKVLKSEIRARMLASGKK